MRSRYAAYALGEVAYLVRTLHPEHPDRARPDEVLLSELRRSRQGLRFARLRVLDHDLAPDGQAGRVLFHAELHQSGAECSFLERSHFARTPEGGWRYQSGETQPLPARTPGLDALTLTTAAFL